MLITFQEEVYFLLICQIYSTYFYKDKQSRDKYATLMALQAKNSKFHSKALALSALTGIKEERQEFCVFDREGNGFVCRKELLIALRNIDLSPSEDELAKIINEANINGDGSISKSEFLKRVEQLDDFGNDIDVQNRVCIFDEKKDMFVSVADLKKDLDLSNTFENNINMPRANNQNKMAFLREKNNHEISFEEFVTILIRGKPSSNTGCKMQQCSAEGVSETEKWRTRWRRNAAMRSSSVIFPKTWWILLASVALKVNKEKKVELSLTAYYWLQE